MSESAAPAGVKALGLSSKELRRRVAAIQNNESFQTRVGQAFAMRFTDREPSPYVEKQIYDGFPDPADQLLMDQFQNAVWEDRADLADRIKDPRLSEFAWRLIYFERRYLVPDAKIAKLDEWLIDRVLTKDDTVPWTTVEKALHEADDLLEKCTGDEAALLDEVKHYLQNFAEHLSSN